MKLELYYPVKPFIITQGWGISNPTYLQFGFSKHNGVDFIPYTGAVTFPLYAPLKLTVIEIGTQPGAGNFVRFISQDTWEVDGVKCYVGGIFMHLKEPSVNLMQTCNVGDQLGIANNTGNSTGPHTHLSLYKLGNDKVTRLDTDKEVNYTFNPQPYWNGKFAVDIKIKLIQTLISLLQKLLTFIK